MYCSSPSGGIDSGFWFFKNCIYSFNSAVLTLVSPARASVLVRSSHIPKYPNKIHAARATTATAAPAIIKTLPFLVILDFLLSFIISSVRCFCCSFASLLSTFLLFFLVSSSFFSSIPLSASHFKRFL